MYTRTLAALLLLLFLPALVFADVVCDGVDDDLDTNLALSTFLSASTGTMTLWYKPTGTADSTASPDCYNGEFLLGDMADTGNTAMGILRNGNLSGQDRLCVWNFDGSTDQVPSAYTTNAWTHLVWLHSGGTLSFYKDGALVSSTASGDTTDMVRKVRMCNGAPASLKMGEGVFAEALLYPTALSAAEIEVLARSQLHRVGWSVPSAAWDFSLCGEGASCNAVVFPDRSGNARTITASGTTGQASSFVSYPWGVD